MALVCAQLGLRFIAVMPEGVSNERVLMIQAYGGAIHIVSKQAGMRASIAKSEALAQEIGAFLPRQFPNPENAEAQEFGCSRLRTAQLSHQRKCFRAGRSAAHQ